jgi:hypothetical protein
LHLDGNACGEKKYLDVEDCGHNPSQERKTWDIHMFRGGNNELYRTQLFIKKDF